MSLEKVIQKHVEMHEAIAKAMTWKPKGFTNATRFLIRFLVFILTVKWFGFKPDDPLIMAIGSFFVWLVSYKVLKVLLLGLHLALLTNIPRIPITLMEELGVPRKLIGKYIRDWYWRHS